MPMIIQSTIQPLEGNWTPIDSTLFATFLPASAIMAITDEEYKTFHKIDRALFVRLVTTINREPIESMQMMALWLWLENLGFPNIIWKMLSLTDPVVQVIAEEASRCINCLSSSTLLVSTDTNIPMTQNLLEKPISLQFIHHHRDIAVLGIAKIINEVCLRAFNDIMEDVIAKAAKESVPLGNNVSGGSADHDQQGSSSGVRVRNTGFVLRKSILKK